MPPFAVYPCSLHFYALLSSLPLRFLCNQYVCSMQVPGGTSAVHRMKWRWWCQSSPKNKSASSSMITTFPTCLTLNLWAVALRPPSLIKRLYCNRAIQFIRAQVLKPLPRQLVCCTWAHINPVVREITRDFNLSTTYSQDRTWFSNHTSHVT